jgi:hypothetical protein
MGDGMSLVKIIISKANHSGKMATLKINLPGFAVLINHALLTIDTNRPIFTFSQEEKAAEGLKT